MSSPSVAIVVPTVAAERHLPTLLESIEALDYPRDRFETIVVDNRPSPASRALFARRGDVLVLEQTENLGFAAAVDVGAETATADLLAVCNDDMRLDAAWLSELVGAHHRHGGCVAGLILDWEGERVDFAGGFANLHGFAGQYAFGERLTDVDVEDGRRLPFPCGGSMLVERRLFLGLGGFDRAFFALLEDVDFGWRLRLAGHGTHLAASARSFHRHGATTRTLLEDRERLFLFERNALLMLIKNAGDDALPRLLAYALFLLAARAAASEESPPPGLRAVEDVAGQLDATLEKRVRVQRLRRRDDAELLSELGEPYLAVHSDEQYLEASALLARALRLHELAGRTTAADPTAEIRQLLDSWRVRYGVGRSPLWHLRRSTAEVLRRARRAR